MADTHNIQRERIRQSSNIQVEGCVAHTHIQTGVYLRNSKNCQCSLKRVLGLFATASAEERGVYDTAGEEEGHQDEMLSPACQCRNPPYEKVGHRSEMVSQASWCWNPSYHTIAIRSCGRYAWMPPSKESHNHDNRRRQHGRSEEDQGWVKQWNKQQVSEADPPLFTLTN